MSMDDRDGVIWIDGKLVPWRDATVHVLTHTLHYGLGVFEGVRAYKTDKGTAIFRLQAHTDRLFRSAHILNLSIPFDKETINAAICTAVRENDMEFGYIRPMCFLGSEGMGLRADALKVHVMVAAWSWGSYLGAENMEKGIRVKTSSYTRHHVNITMCKAKANGNYINSMLALNEALSCGCDEALLLDSEGYVAEGSGENIFIPSASLAGVPKDGTRIFGLYEPIHGSAPRHAGQNDINPIAMIMSTAMMLRYSLALLDEASVIEKAVEDILNEGYRTYDIMGENMKRVGTREMGDLMVKKVAG